MKLARSLCVKLSIVLVLVIMIASWVPEFLKVMIAVEDLRRLQNAKQRYIESIGEAPSGDWGLEALLDDPGLEGWRGPYIIGELPQDPWGNDYHYIHPNERYPFGRIICWGADGKPGGSLFAADLYFYY